MTWLKLFCLAPYKKGRKLLGVFTDKKKAGQWADAARAAAAARHRTGRDFVPFSLFLPLTSSIVI